MVSMWVGAFACCGWGHLCAQVDGWLVGWNGRAQQLSADTWAQPYPHILTPVMAPHSLSRPQVSFPRISAIFRLTLLRLHVHTQKERDTHTPDAECAIVSLCRVLRVDGLEQRRGALLRPHDARSQLVRIVAVIVCIPSDIAPALQELSHNGEGGIREMRISRCLCARI